MYLKRVSAHFPEFEGNPNIGEPFAMGATLRTATRLVHATSLTLRTSFCRSYSRLGRAGVSISSTRPVDPRHETSRHRCTCVEAAAVDVNIATGEKPVDPYGFPALHVVLPFRQLLAVFDVV